MSTSDHGRFCWYDLMTKDVEASKKFYTELFGWRVDQVDMGEHPYNMLFAGERPIGGIVHLQAGDEIPTHWIPYVAVDDIKDSCAKADKLGGKVCVPATDIGPGVFAVVEDPQGGFFSAWQGKEPVPDPAPKGTAGVFCWNECMTTDSEKGAKFYEGMFGWKTESMKMEVGGCEVLYRVFFRGDQHHGGIMDLPPEALEQGARPHWLSYVEVPVVDDAMAKAAKLGATVLCPCTDIPETGRFCVIQDPQGGTLALFTGLK